MNKLKLGPKVKFKKAKLPLKKKLVGNYTILEPLNVSKHSKDIYSEYLKDKKNIIWTYLPYGPFKTYLNFRNWMKSFCLNKDPFFYSIYSKKHKKYCGMASYLRIEPDHGSIEVGHINYSPLLQNSVEGTETMYLMMKNAFEVLGNRRYEWKCNNLNSSSKKAALRLGFKFEGVFRQMFIFKGRSRDSAWFSILDKEWPKNKKRFLNYLKKINFDLMLADGFNLTTIELDEGEKIPSDLRKFDGMFCMGGPMDTFMEQEYPWLIEEKKAIKEFVVNLKKPYLGFCLGCQLLGEVIGGKVVKSNPAEIGIMDINFTKEKNEDILFSKFPEQIKSLQWHSYEVQGIENNKDVTLLASSPSYQISNF